MPGLPQNITASSALFVDFDRDSRKADRSEQDRQFIGGTGRPQCSEKE
jgi:hypothetical protein